MQLWRCRWCSLEFGMSARRTVRNSISSSPPTDPPIHRSTEKPSGWDRRAGLPPANEFAAPATQCRPSPTGRGRAGAVREYDQILRSAHRLRCGTESFGRAPPSQNDRRGQARRKALFLKQLKPRTAAKRTGRGLWQFQPRLQPPGRRPPKHRPRRLTAPDPRNPPIPSHPPRPHPSPARWRRRPRTRRWRPGGQSARRTR
jgi:hypothetical protein